MNEAEVLHTVESTFIIVFLMLSILSVKKFIKQVASGCLLIYPLCLIKTLDCFIIYYYEFADMLGPGSF